MDSGGGFTLLEAIVIALVGLGGVLVGAAMTIVIEAWRQIHRGRSAARIIRHEISNNVNKTVLALLARHADVTLTDDAWRQFGLEVSELLPDDVFLEVSLNYGGLFIIRGWLDLVDEEDRFAEAKSNIREWQVSSLIDAGRLLQVRGRRRLPQLFDILLGRATQFRGTMPDVETARSVATLTLEKLEDELGRMMPGSGLGGGMSTAVNPTRDARRKTAETESM